MEYDRWSRCRLWSGGAEARGWWRDCCNHGERAESVRRQVTETDVFDTSSWLTLIEDEAGAEKVRELLEKVSRGEVVALVSLMSFMEVYYITLQEREQAEAQERAA